MAEKWYEYDDITGEYTEIPIVDASQEVSDLLYGPGYAVDTHARDLFEAAVFDHSADAYQALVDYIWDEYGIDFEDAFSWEDFREWYGGA